jgi:hypothetical protein
MFIVGMFTNLLTNGLPGVGGVYAMSTAVVEAIVFPMANVFVACRKIAGVICTIELTSAWSL